MKIMIDARLLGREQYSGIATHTRNIIDHLIARAPEHRFTLFYNGWKKIPLPDRWMNAPNVSVIDRRIPNKLLRLLPLYPDRDQPIDLLYSPHIDYLRHRAPRVLTVHDLSFLYYPYFFTLKQRLWHRLQSIPHQINRARHIVTNSNYTKQTIIETLKVPEEKITVIYPGIDQPLLNAGSSQNRRPFILYLGAIEPRKNISAIIRAFNIIKTKSAHHDLQLIVAGATSWQGEEIFSDIARSPYQNDIIIRGSITHKEKIVLYTEARAFIYPSFFEGFGFPPLEAQACGCPVIASNRSSLIETLGNSALLFNPWKTAQLAEAIDSLLTNTSRRQQLVSAGLENSKRFSWTQCVGQLLDTFSSCV